MELRSYLSILAKRWRIVLAATLIVAILALALSFLIPPKYEAISILRVSTPLGGSLGDTYYQTSFATRLMNTYAQIAMSESMMISLKETLDLEVVPDVTIKTIPDSEIIQIIVESGDPTIAAKAANTLAELLIKSQLELSNSNPDLKNLDILTQRKDELQLALSEAQAEYDQLIQDNSQITAEIAVLDRKITIKESSLVTLTNQYEEVVISSKVFGYLSYENTKNALLDEIAILEQKLETIYQQYKSLLAKSNENEQNIFMVRLTIENMQRAYSDLLLQYNSAVVASSRQANDQNVVIISPATEPSSSSSPSWFFVFGLGVLLGLIVGILLAFVSESSRSS